MTTNPDIRFAKSPVDYMFRWLGLKFLSPEDQEALGLRHGTEQTEGETAREALESLQADGVLDPLQGGVLPFRPKVEATDAPPCSECGAIMVRNGACYACINCGATSGCS